MPTRIQVCRYEEFIQPTTPLDPFSAVISWIRGLRSTDYVSDLLETKHSFSSANHIKKAASSISAHTQTAISFLEQAFSGIPELSYLPIYYALANLAKAAIAAGGYLAKLTQQRRHGATWTGISTRSHNLLTDHIALQGEGTIPLLYQTLTGTMWPNTPQKTSDGRQILTPKRQVFLRDIYPYISCVSHEYTQTYDLPARLLNVCAYTEITKNSGKLVIECLGDKPSALKRKIKLATGLQVKEDKFVSKSVTGKTQEEIHKELTVGLRRYLLYEVSRSLPVHKNRPELGAQIQYVGTYTPLSASNLLLPEELPILLAFFHLSNVVRYDPNRLKRLLDSRASGLLEVFIREGAFRYLVLFWSYMNRQSFLISAGI